MNHCYARTTINYVQFLAQAANLLVDWLLWSNLLTFQFLPGLQATSVHQPPALSFFSCRSCPSLEWPFPCHPRFSSAHRDWAQSLSFFRQGRKVYYTGRLAPITNQSFCLQATSISVKPASSSSWQWAKTPGWWWTTWSPRKKWPGIVRRVRIGSAHGLSTVFEGLKRYPVHLNHQTLTELGEFFEAPYCSLWSCRTIPWYASTQASWL